MSNWATSTVSRGSFIAGSALALGGTIPAASVSSQTRQATGTIPAIAQTPYSTAPAIVEPPATSAAGYSGSLSQLPHVTKTMFVTAPGSPIWTLEISTGILWEVKSVFYKVITSSAVQNRFPYLSFLDVNGLPGIVMEVVISSVAVLASTTTSCTWARGLNASGWTSASAGIFTAGLPEVLMDALHVYSVAGALAGLDAADTVTSIAVTVEEYTLPAGVSG